MVQLVLRIQPSHSEKSSSIVARSAPGRSIIMKFIVTTADYSASKMLYKLTTISGGKKKNFLSEMMTTE